MGLVLALVVLTAIGRVGAAATRRAHADAVADLVALAAATAGHAGAEAVSASNGAQLVSSELRGDVAVVVVRYAEVRAVAAARSVRTSP